MRLAVGTAAFRSAMPRIATAQRTASTTLRAHQYRRALTTAEPTIGLLRHRAADLPAICRRATRAALRHDVRSMLRGKIIHIGISFGFRRNGQWPPAQN